MTKLYSNEIVFKGHPDKICDQISDAILDAYISIDKDVRAGIETVGGKGKVFITGEVSGKGIDIVNPVDITKRILLENDYEVDNYEIINNIGTQSADISQGVDVGGAGDQGMMFGYACRETDRLIPKAMAILQDLSKGYTILHDRMPGDFYPDGKAQITGYYDDDFKLIKIKTFTVSYQNSEVNRDYTDTLIRQLADEICNRYGVEVEEYLINPTGKFFIGGFEGDSGLTGRKIVVDSYQSFAPVGGGAFSGKDPTKVDRSGAYKARQLAIIALKEFDLEWCEIQLSYAIGVAEPLAIYIDSNKGNIEVPKDWYAECTPKKMIEDLNLKSPIYEQTAQYGHFGQGFIWEV